MTRPGQEYGGLLGDLRPAELRELQALGRRQTFRRNARLMGERQDGDRVMVVLEGRVKLTMNNGRGRDVVLDFLSPGDLLGDLAVIDGRSRSATVVALERVEVITVSGRDFLEFLAARPAASLTTLRQLATRLRDSDSKRVNFVSTDSVGRVAASLAELAERFGTASGTGVVIDLPITQEELAGWSGASLEATTKALRVLRDLGYIATARRVMTIHDLAAVQNRANMSSDAF